jgi:hypothetical protein
VWPIRNNQRVAPLVERLFEFNSLVEISCFPHQQTFEREAIPGSGVTNAQSIARAQQGISRRIHIRIHMRHRLARTEQKGYVQLWQRA